MLENGHWLQAAAALAAVLLLIWLASRALAGRPGAVQRPGRRLAVQEVLAIDPRRRLLLVRCDGRELLLLTGGTQDTVIDWLTQERGA